MFNSHIQRIPCQIDIIYFEPSEIITNGNMSTEYIEYDVYDRKGYKANWLRDKITDEDEEKIYEDFLKYKNGY